MGRMSGGNSLEDEYSGDVPPRPGVHDGALRRAVDEGHQGHHDDGQQDDHADEVGAHQLPTFGALPC